MSLIRRTFPRVGKPDPPSLAAAIAPLLTLAGGFFLGYDEKAQLVSVEYGDWTGVDLTAVQSAITACIVQTDRTDGKTVIDNLPIWEKGAWLVLLDEINLIRSLLSPSQPARTINQFYAAIRSKIDTL